MMSPFKIRVLVSGLLVLCLLSLFWMDGRDRVIGLTELVAAAGAWACAVWLWRDEWNRPNLRNLGKRIAVLTAFAGLAFGGGVAASSLAHHFKLSATNKQLEQDNRKLAEAVAAFRWHLSRAGNVTVDEAINLHREQVALADHLKRVGLSKD